MSSFWRDRPVLVTGATGLVGGALVEKLLAASADLVCLVRDWIPQSELVASRAIERVLGEFEVDTVIHLAAQTIVGVANRNPVSTFDTNIRGTWEVLEACRRSPCVKQIVMASSDKAYGEQSKLPYDEDTPLDGRHPYDASKSCADILAQTYAKTFSLPVAITRCGNFYGGGDLNWNRIVPGTIRSAIRGERPVIRSDGTPVRDYFHAEDGAHAYITLAEALAADRSLSGQAFNFSNEQPITVLELTERLLRHLGSSLRPEIRNEATNEIPHQYLSAARARARLGWAPLYDLDAGLEKTIAWYRRFFGAER